MIQRAKIAHFTDRGHKLRGIVHVGAHEGQEIPYYLHAGHTPIICFEANPMVALRLENSLPADAPVDVHACALGDESGFAPLWIPRHLHDDTDDEQSASFLRADRESGYDWGGRDLDGRYEIVPVYRFDEWADTDGPWDKLAQTDTLVVDVQGYELPVLRGFGRWLGLFDFLNIECSEVPIYEGGAPASEVIDFLAQRGFRQDSPITTHDDIFFVREGL